MVASELSGPLVLVSAAAVVNPVSGSTTRWALNPSCRFSRDLRVCRDSGSTVEIIRSGATFRAIRHRPSVPSDPSAGSTSCPATKARRATASAGLPPAAVICVDVQRGDQGERVGDQLRHQRLSSGGVVPGDRRLPRLGVVIGAHRHDQVRQRRERPGRPGGPRRSAASRCLGGRPHHPARSSPAPAGSGPGPHRSR